MEVVALTHNETTMFVLVLILGFLEHASGSEFIVNAGKTSYNYSEPGITHSTLF